MDNRELMIEMVDCGIIDAREALIMCLKWMSMADIKEMMKANEIDEYPVIDGDY